jgi:hypothetical protein
MVADIAPNAVQTTGTARLVVGLPAQPRYATGVPLDLLKLDLDRLLWSPAGVFTVDEGGVSASGDLKAFGTYLVASPPFGAFAGDVGAPSVPRFQIALSADGPPTSSVPPGTAGVFAAFEYAGMDGTPVTVRTTDARGLVAFEQTRAYTGHGNAAVEMAHDGAAWEVGSYVTAVLMPPRAQPVHEVAWTVSDQASAPSETEPAWPTADSLWGPLPAWPSASRCVPPAGWYAYVVQPGDTPFTLAARTGIGVQDLLDANCLSAGQLGAGDLVYLPRPPARQPGSSSGGVPPDAPTLPWSGPPAAPPWTAPTAGNEWPWPTSPRPTGAWPTQEWPTQPWTEPWPEKPSPGPATAAPRPTSAAPPVFPTAADPPDIPTAMPFPQEPTPKWATMPPEAPTP